MLDKLGDEVTHSPWKVNRTLKIRGRLTISSGPYHLTSEGEPERLTLRTGSWKTLMQLRKSEYHSSLSARASPFRKKG